VARPNAKKRDEVLLLLADGNTVAGAARAAGIHRNTVFNWLNEPEFAARLRELWQERIDAGRIAGANGIQAAFTHLREIGADREYNRANRDRIQAWDRLLTHALNIVDYDRHCREIERLAKLEEAENPEFAARLREQRQAASEGVMGAGQEDRGGCPN
jgi:hypothetical protein